MRKYLCLLGGAAFLGATAFLTGCASTDAAKTTHADAGPSGSRLWAQNCARCHNSRSPSDYSGAQWETAMMHMRVRGGLTAEEHRKILEFLQSGN